MSELETKLIKSPKFLDDDCSDEDSSTTNEYCSSTFSTAYRKKRVSFVSIILRKLFPLDKDRIISLSNEVKEYKAKMMQSKQKLENFFGQPIPFDINISEIEVHGLKAILQSKVPMCYFMYSMLEDYSAENLVS